MAFAPLPKLRIVTLSDDAACSAALEAQARSWGASIHSLSSTPDQLRKELAASPCDLLIIDDSAARPDTIRALIDLRAQMADSFPPFIRLLRETTADELSDGRRCVALRKPLRPSALHRSIRTLLGAAPPRVAAPNKGPTPTESVERVPETADTYATEYPLRILIVEDNQINTKVLVNILKKLGYRADTAENGEIGLRAAESIQYDLILMDLQMPVMDGLESARRILASQAIQHPPYISAFTANARQEDRDACRATGLHDFAAKPARIPEIKAVLQRGYEWLQERIASR